MESILVKQANSSPDATAVVDGDYKVSYRELIARADILAGILKEQNTKLETPICIVTSPGLHQTLAQIAVLRAGGTCVPIDPNIPADRLRMMFSDLDSTHVITSNEYSNNTKDWKQIFIEPVLKAEVNLDGNEEIALAAGCPETHRSHIIFTSGSTGRPKPVQVLSSSILHALQNFPLGPLRPSDRMTALINPGFDLSIFEMWGTLLAGAAIVRVPDLVCSDPFALHDFVKQNDITVMIIPTSLFHVVALMMPGAFGGLRHVVVGGEAISCNAVREVLKTAAPEHLWNGYGPAEATIFATMGRLDEKEAQQSRITIGSAIGDTQVMLLDDDQNPITEPGITGEIYIAGPQVSPGYLNRPEENGKRFLVANSKTLKFASDGDMRVYRTGDLAQWRDDDNGTLEYVGRTDDQIKISGHRIEPGDVARTVEEHPDVHSCIVKYQPKDILGFLEAYVVPVNREQEFRSEKLIEWAKAKLPSYMVPKFIYKKRCLPTSANGKVDLNALQPVDDEDSANGRVEFNEPQPVELNGPQTVDDEESLTTWLKSTIKGYLFEAELKPTDDFFSLGLESLQAARLIGQIRQKKGRTITIAQLHAHPTIESLAGFLESSTEENEQVFSVDQWVNDSHLLDTTIMPPDWQALDEGRVFLTGATGFLGAQILHDLLSMPTVQRVACLARAQGGISASARIQQNLQKYKLWDDDLEKTQKIMVLEGDLTHPSLGLKEEKFTWLTNWASVVFHVGARVNWCDPYEAHYKPNVLGTCNVIRAAMSGRRKTLHYVSSIDVWSVTGFINKIDRVYEDEPLMPHIGALPYDTGYSASQFVAEELVRRARQCGLPTAIYRPGFIIGHSKNAIANERDYFSRVVLGSIQCGYFPNLPNEYLEYVTVDYVSAAIIHIASNRENLGQSYHIAPPNRPETDDYDEKYKMLQEIGFPLERVEFDEWVDKVRDSPGNAMESMMPLLEERVYDGRLGRLQTSKDPPVYDATNAKRVLKDRPDIKHVPLTAPLLQRFIQNWLEQGYYSSDPQSKRNRAIANGTSNNAAIPGDMIQDAQ